MNLLVADIGGTNARFGFQKNINAQISNINHFKCKDFNKIEDAITFYIKRNKLNVDNIVLAVAGPCENNLVKLTNNNWNFYKSKLSKKFNVKSFLAINDFAAQGFGFIKFFKTKNISCSKQFLDDFDLKLVKEGNSLENTNLLIVGPGTGLGVCTLTSLNSLVFPIEGEGGNTNFSPQNKLEIELLKFLLKDKEYISFEDVVSGRGLKNIYKFLKFNNKQTIKNSILPDQIGALALKNDIVAIESVKFMFSILGTMISNIILINRCQKGVIISGGMIKKLYTFLYQSDFLKNFSNKGYYKNYVEKVPIFFSDDDNVALKGAAECFKNKYFTKHRTIYNI